ncbi:adenosylcobinamide-GDP ribazoletransferase [Methylovulum psychrotolerans]|uniref:adenosylcobinamide-GDP ribazoletransferase n=1 Tax=Methylovulum psychrotolerans TaxID=1704499 RepID=UPI001BFF197C|nr:adenosylcobinamide-GDP ribazoletransferase [Methylovulum psychrotolerans]MBT9096798.1 adenosylcobinamide-GDP ribazoletransferase [Methylovulum psychrotolerans]
MFKLKHFQLALSFYTRLPTPQNLDYQQLPQASVYLPLVGWVVGLGCGLVFAGAALLWSPWTAAILAVVAGIFLTGAFHEDGFADVCDGFGGGWGQERILEIMKDSRVGAYGAIGIGLLLLLKISVLAALPVAVVPWLLWAGHSASRLPPLLLMRHYEYARVGASKGAAGVFKPDSRALGFAALCALLPLLGLPLWCWWAVLPMLAVNALLGGYFYRQIGGYTGDCLGAAQQVAEVVFYLAVSGLWTFI